VRSNVYDGLSGQFLRNARAQTILVSLLTAVLVAFAPASTRIGENMDDRDVVQTALLSFFKPEIWYAREWKTSSHVVLRIPPKTPKRGDFAKLLDSLIENVKRELEAAKVDKEAADYARRDAAALERLLPLQRSSKGPQAFDLPKDRPLSEYTWDRRINTTQKDWAHLRPFRPGMKADPEFAGVRVFAECGLPAYSPDRNVSIVSMAIPWSIHSADVTFVLKRGKNGWEIVYGGGIFFV
jgi:hypothetical protein